MDVKGKLVASECGTFSTPFVQVALLHKISFVAVGAFLSAHTAPIEPILLALEVIVAGTVRKLLRNTWGND